MARYVLRRLLRSPLFAAMTLITLAIGIGANTAIFSVIDGVLLKPLPYPEPDRLVGLWHTAAHLNIKEVEICPSLYFTYREQSRTFQSVGAYTSGSVSVTQIGEPEQVKSLWITREVLPMLGAQPAAGRLFSAEDDTDGSPKTAILTYGYWQRRFGGSRAAIGQRIVVDGDARQIIGVLPRDFRFLNAGPSLIFPLRFNRNKVFLGNFSYRGIARLRPGATVAQANADVARMLPIWLKTFPPPPGLSAKLFEDAGLGPKLRPFMQDVVGDIGSMLWVLMGAIGAVLLIACANVANLLLVRAEGRQHELAIRAALGAGWRRIAGELLFESGFLGLAGGALGVGLAFGALRLLTVKAPAGLPRIDEIGIDARALLFAFAITLFASALFGVLPIFKYAGVRPGTGLRESNRSVSASRERHRARSLLVVVQVALALVLLIGSGLMIRTFQSLRRVDPGFTQPADVLTLRVSIPEALVKDGARAIHMHSDIASKIAAIPGVESVALTNSIAMDGDGSNDVVFMEGHAVAEGQIPPLRRFKFISPGFFHTMGRRFVAGRDLTWTDTFNFHPVAVISENFAREYWGSPADALGKRIRESAKDDWREIVGVVANEYDDGVQTKPPTVAYWPLMMKNFWGNEVFSQRTAAYAIRSRRTGTPALLNEVRQAVWSVSPNSPLANVQTLDEIYSKSMARTTFTLIMLALAGAMAMTLGVVGIYGVISYSVTTRRREIGIRMALGAREQQVSGMFVRDGLMLAAAGAVCGIAAAAGLTRLLNSMLFGVRALDVSTYAAVSLGLVAAATFASYIPARRAAAVDPVETLRSE